MQNEIIVRKAITADSEMITQFNIALARETEGKELATEKVSHGVRGLLEAPLNGFYLVAELDGQIAGALMVTTEWSDWRNGQYWWIQSVYVRPEFRRRGVYRTMYSAVRGLAEENPKVCGCRLYVEVQNTTAQEAYSKLGMNPTNYKVFEELFRN